MATRYPTSSETAAFRGAHLTGTPQRELSSEMMNFEDEDLESYSAGLKTKLNKNPTRIAVIK